MSILIKGMEMPTTCGNCHVHKLWAYDDEAQCVIKRELWTKYSERNPDCPLIEIPDGHGDLIDRDWMLGNWFIYLNPRTMIEDAPTVIPSDKDGEA